MRPLWKGAIGFGLVTIPVSLYPATRREELKFQMLRKSDLQESIQQSQGKAKARKPAMKARPKKAPGKRKVA